ncbi:MAG TPA: hypothetical protein VK171_09280, partial [Fimbriimonas sp.]|nr:hypothetical protein [Fimbriimonas sp.]
LLLGALLVGGCLCFIEARSVRFWAERIPYPSAHSMFNDMQTQHAQALEMESKVAQNLKSISNTLLTQVDQANYSRGRVNLEAITYRNNPYGYYAPRQVGANRFLHVPVLATKQYSFVDAQEVISAKLGTIAVRQSERRNLMRWLGTLLNTSSFDRLASGMPYIVSAIVLVFGVSYLMSLLGAKVGIAAVTRRRRILS